VSLKTELYQILKAYALKAKNPVINYETFVEFLDKYAERHTEEFPELCAARGAGFVEKTSAGLMRLEEEKYVRLQKTSNRIHLIKVVVYYIELVEQQYKKIISQGDAVLPSPESVGLHIEPELLTPVNIRADFEAYLEKEPSGIPELLNISFPDVSKTLILSSKLLEKPLIEVSLQKIRIYLREQKNAQYLQHKLLPLFPQREATLKNLIVNAVTKSDLTLQEFMVPSDQTFQFWTQVASMLLKEYGPKADKLEEEIDLCIACNIVNFYAVYFKGKTQKARESEAALKILVHQFSKPPYAYTFHDIYQFKDSKGLAVVKRIDRDVFAIYLESSTTPKDKVSLPEILKIKTPDKTEYFIRSDCAVKVLLSRAYGLAKGCKTRLVSYWADVLKNNQKLPEMLEDLNFSREVENYIKTTDPVFYALLNFNLLFLLRDQIKMPQVETDFTGALLDVKTKSVVPADKILNLSRKTVYTEARLRLPFWQVIPLFSAIVRFFMNLFRPRAVRSPVGKNKARKEEPKPLPSGDENQTAQKAHYQEEIEALIRHYLGSGDIQKEMPALISLWNPLLDPQAKQNLVEDVNSLVRDFLRVKKYRTRLRAPAIGQVDQLAAELSASRNLEAIRDKQHLREYITLYMLKLLHMV
jgi:hypothetical protein